MSTVTRRTAIKRLFMFGAIPVAAVAAKTLDPTGEPLPEATSIVVKGDNLMLSGIAITMDGTGKPGIHIQGEHTRSTMNNIHINGNGSPGPGIQMEGASTLQGLRLKDA